MSSDDDILRLEITRKTAVAALGALSVAERHSTDPELTECVQEFMAALMATAKAN